MDLNVRDLIRIDETDENQDGYPVVSVKFLGVEVERAVAYMWGSDKQYQVTDEYVENAERVIKELWKQMGENV